MHDLSTSEKFWYVVKEALKSPIGLAIWVAGALATLCLLQVGTSLWWLAPAATVAAQLVRIFRHLHDEEYLHTLFVRRQERQETLTDQQVEAILEAMDFETRQRLRYILQLQREIAKETRTSDVGDYARKDLERIASQLGPLVQRAVRIAQRKQQLTKYLYNVDERALEGYCNNLRQRIEATTDKVSKEQYGQALRAREAELQTYRAIAQAAARIDSQLENVEATFASWKARVIRIKTADVASAAAVSQDFYQEIEALNSDIDLLDTSVSEALSADQELSLHNQQNG